MFRDSDAFVLPTYSENFGIAIAEAMSWGLPVITTTGTPWSALSDPSMGYIKPNARLVLHCFAYSVKITMNLMRWEKGAGHSSNLISGIQ